MIHLVIARIVLMNRMLVTLWILLLSTFITHAQAAELELKNFRFGILQLQQNGDYELKTETTHIPKRLKSTGFRFGFSFDNPRNTFLEYHLVIHAPAQVTQITGGLQHSAQDTLVGEPTYSREKHIVDQIWFDQDDPLGQYRIEVYVGGIKRFATDFTVTH